MVEAIGTVSDLLVRYGGHTQAAGFTIPTGRIPEARERMEAHAGAKLGSLDLSPVLAIDATATLPEMTMEVQEWLTSLEPFGRGNRRPVFASLGVDVVEARLVGQTQQHLRLRVRQSGREMTALAFNQAEDWRSSGLGAGENRLDLAYTLMLDSWQGQETLSLRVSHFRAAQS